MKITDRDTFIRDIPSVIRVDLLSVAVLMCSSVERELATVRQEKESLTQQLLNTIKHKVALSQELDAWQVWLCVSSNRSVNNVFLC